MKTIKLITILLLTTFLVSCQGPQIKPQVGTNISFQFNRCRLFCYDIMKAKKTKPEKCYEYPKEIPREYPFYFEEAEKTIKIKRRFRRDKKKRIRYLKFIPGNYALDACDETLGFYIGDYAVKIKPWANKSIKYYENRE